MTQELHCYRVWMKDGYAGLYDATSGDDAKSQAVARTEIAMDGAAMTPAEKRKALTVDKVEKLGD